MSVHNPYLTAPKPPVWPWIVGAVLVVVSTVIVFIGSFAVSAVLAQVANRTAVPAVEQAVLDFDAAYENVDCAEFHRVVDDRLADQLADGEFSCAIWQAKADALWIDDEYGYSVEIYESHVDGDRGFVYTEEEFAGESTTYSYTLAHADQGWIVIGYDRF